MRVVPGIMKCGVVLACCAILASVSSCGHSGLSRSKAKKLISEHQQFTADIFSLGLKDDAESQRSAMDAGLWSFKDEIGLRWFELTPKGKELFLDLETSTDPQFRKTPAWLQLKGGWKRKMLQVTGITDIDQSKKAVDFVWAVANSRSEVADFLNLGPFKGSAELRLYDDGWRVERVDFRRPIR